MRCKVCGAPGDKVHILSGPGKKDQMIVLCSAHKKGLKRWQRRGGGQPLTSDELDARIDAWHNGDGEGQELHEHLGWTWEQYKQWVETRRMPDV